MLQSAMIARLAGRVASFAKKLALAGIAVTLPLHAALAVGYPQPWAINLQDPASPVDAKIVDLHNILLWVISFICLFVLGLLIWVVLRYSRRANPIPSTTTHNTKLEIIWTAVPVLILLVIAFPSFKLLYYSDRIPANADMTIKVTGHQWYWSYEYAGAGAENGIAFDSHALWDQPSTTDEQARDLAKEASANWLIKSEPLRMLEVDNRLVLPINATARVQITGADVEHSWFLPSMGVNRMAVPGRTNEVWLQPDHEGLFYGQCSMICGTGHGFMPIVIEVVSREQFDAWVKSKKTAVGQLQSAPAARFAAAAH